MVGSDVVIPEAGRVPPTPGYAVLPDGAARGMVVLHEVYGRQPEIDRVVERFGAAGYAAVAPDLFAGQLRPVCLAQAMRAITRGQGRHIDQIRRARTWLCEKTGISVEKVGLIGFCLGGGFALAAGPGFAAVSTNYGDVPSAEVMRGIGPTIGCYGANDILFRKAGDKLKARLEPLGVECETHVFDGVGHSFLTDGHHPIGSALSRPFMHIKYDPAVAEEGWSTIFAFFDKHLSA